MVVVMMMMVVIMIGTDAAHMVVMADLGLADVALKTDNLFPVLAQLAVHDVFPAEHFANPVGERFDQERMIVQVSGFENFHFRVRRSGFVGPVIDSVDQNAGEQKVWKNNNPLVAKFDRMGEPGIDERGRDP